VGQKSNFQWLENSFSGELFFPSYTDENQSEKEYEKATEPLRLFFRCLNYKSGGAVVGDCVHSVHVIGFFYGRKKMTKMRTVWTTE